MYISPEGEGVTDLAYKAPLEEIAANPFDEDEGFQLLQEPPEFADEAFGLGSQSEFGTDGFVSGGKI